MNPPSDRRFRDALINFIFAPHSIAQIAFDIIAIGCAFLGAILLRLPVSLWAEALSVEIHYLPIALALGSAVFFSMGFYRTLWRYASVEAVLFISLAAFVVTTVSTLFINLLDPGALPWSVAIIEWMLLSLIVGGGRIGMRMLRMMRANDHSGETKRVLVFGAGDAGELLARDIINSGSKLRIVGFIDDDPGKIRKSIHGIPIIGTRDDLARIVREREINMVLIALPSVSGAQVRNLLKDLRNQLDSRVALKTLPALSELVNGRVSMKQVREFDIRDLLRRDPIVLDQQRVVRLIRGKCILVSGAGGSIGSEICEQVAQSNPSRLVIFDISEPNLYTISETLGRKFPDLEVVPVVGDISHRWLVERVFREYLPSVVFHAAAYKHVPLMEENSHSALSNNVIGTRVLAAVASEYQVKRFVMISTDKAVRPYNVMGATKRICEMLVEAQNHQSGTNYCAVRFGNVMGSSGSVIPKFEKQILEGGPITVTDPEVTRYFMLTSEAVQLVLQAATLDGAYATYFLDMGEPVRIDDLARDMVQLHGMIPGKDIEIQYTQLRPGEKLHEELCHTGEGRPTPIEKIWIADTPRFNHQGFLDNLDELLEACYEMDHNSLLRSIESLVPDYTPSLNGEPEPQAPLPVEKKTAASHRR